MIHKIKTLYDQGNGLSIRAIAKEVKLSRNTVRKYLRLDEPTICQKLTETTRHKQLDQYQDYIKHLLVTFPELTATKVMRKLLTRFPEIAISERSVRRYVSTMRKQVCSRQARYYQPVLDMVPGVQCQVDPGELRGVMINGVETTVYFVVFVLSYSRLMHVSTSFRPIDTDCFIRMHDAAFRYFGGRPQEMVYDQTKLVVIKEKYRELEINQRFNEYATHAGFTIRACEGYDPESKGKVEAGVKYVKINALYGETFESHQDLDHHLADWLDTVANERIHGTTGEVPRQHYQTHEQQAMHAYFTPDSVRSGGQLLTRKADKTGLLSWQANKYSVPMAYQRQEVAVQALDGYLHIYEQSTQAEITTHAIHPGKGQIIKNNHHYRDTTLRIAELEAELTEKLGVTPSQPLFALLKQTSPKIYKDQLAGIRSIINKQGLPTSEQLTHICQRPSLTATQFSKLLEAVQKAPERLLPEDEKKVITGGLSRYQFSQEQGGRHECY